MFSLTKREQQIVDNVSGSALLLEVVTEAKGHRAEADVFLVNLKSKTGGHTIGFQFSGAGIHFFDSNFGEFDFPNAADDDHLSWPSPCGLSLGLCAAERRGAPAGVAFRQRRRPALADIIGARRMWTVAMISSGSSPRR